jgi:hypothetical protein
MKLVEPNDLAKSSIDMNNVAPLTFDDLISRTRSSLTKIQHRAPVQRWCYHQSEIDLLS